MHSNQRINLDVLEQESSIITLQQPRCFFFVQYTSVIPTIFRPISVLLSRAVPYLYHRIYKALYQHLIILRFPRQCTLLQHKTFMQLYRASEITNSSVSRTTTCRVLWLNILTLLFRFTNHSRFSWDVHRGTRITEVFYSGLLKPSQAMLATTSVR